MDRTDQLRAFIQVAEMGSFTRAADVLECPRATVSLAIQQLESVLGVRLFHRTTRRVQLTPDGLLLLPRAQALIMDCENLEVMFRERHDAIAGRLSIDVPSRVARRMLAPALPQLLHRHPRLDVVLGSSDRHVDLVAEGIDCALRFGTLSDSSLVVRRLGEAVMVNCASPGYLERVGGLPDLAVLCNGHHQLVGYGSSSNGRDQIFDLIENDEPRQISLPSRVQVNNAESYIACCEAGLGIIQVPRFDVEDLLEQSTLIEVLHEWRAPPMPVSVVYPHRRHRTSRIDAFIEWLGELLAPQLSG
ncbi:LysR family transcriptional regulator [Halomonas cupida]|uniref:DNA-binding transcriptional regulator, LysR family n=1 Tax=Halomonas cupida TaxID=44933 RepID=A0A1M7J0T2_9GAMM|nr:LysR family transcriptional regulator [Halomonas cupida]GEN24264.1 LysR family transcriptional regulator [Halomonas cupida]SHM46512.1 DNA-binding transcriptional regulator, LysR family [Halomonas cupida]